MEALMVNLFLHNETHISTAENRGDNMHINKQNLLWAIIKGSILGWQHWEKKLIPSHLSWRDAKSCAQDRAAGFQRNDTGLLLQEAYQWARQTAWRFRGTRELEDRVSLVSFASYTEFECCPTSRLWINYNVLQCTELLNLEWSSYCFF